MKEEMKEALFDLLGYEGLYCITSSGKIWSIKANSFLSPETIRGGYKRVCLRKGKEDRHFLVHRLVAKQFLDNPNNFDTVDHIDRNKSNNDVTNLRWMSRHENDQIGHEKAIRCVETGKIYRSLTRAGEEIGIPTSSLSFCISGRYNTAGGFHWELL